MAPDTRDLDDTVTHPPRVPMPRPMIKDLDDTITVQRGERVLTPVTPPTAPIVTQPVDLVEPLPSAPLLPAQQLPAQLLPEPLPPAPPVPAPLVPPAAALAPEIVDNVWSQPLPETPRPFRLRLADGTLVSLDQPAYLGRKPRVPRIHPGGTPVLVTFDSPLREVSSTHLVLSTIGGAIVATDLKSTNGSVLRVPGSAPRTLIGGESAVVTAGTVIELGDGNLVELLAPDPDAPSPDSSGARP
ncbi:MAG: hypothetical protein ABJA11_02875 [Pseudolysinimonas sp.]